MTYEYVCEACGHQWEAEQSIKDSPLKKCVSCGTEKAKRLISGGTGFLLKGGGWYADLYGSPGSGANKSADDKGSKSATKADGAKSDAKSEGASSGAKSEATSSGDGKPAASSTPASSSTSSSSSSSSSSSAAS